MKKTKIIATIWPVTGNKESIIELYKAWINIIRFNFSHENYDNAKRIIKIINELNEKNITKLSLLLDTKWPEIRTWDIDWKNKYKLWDKFKIYVSSDIKVDNNNLFCDYNNLIEDIDIWKNIIIDSWLFRVKVLEKNKDYLLVEALNSAIIWSRRHINLPWVILNLPWVTKKDKEDIIFAIENDFSYIAASFIRSSSNVEEIKWIFKEYSCSYIKIISKIENQEWIDNLDEIINVSDGIMIARWDLWVEVPIEKLPIYQKKIAKKCRNNWKFFITATHLLETMIDNPFPTRAETSDVFNSVLQKADCLMLSWETSIWKFPIETVKLMTSIISEAEKVTKYTFNDYENNNLSSRDIEKKLLIRSSLFVWKELWVKALIILTKSWLLARLTSAYRPSFPVYSFSPINTSVKNTNILFWINPILLSNWDISDYSKTLDYAISYLLDNNIVNKQDRIIAINDIQKQGQEYPIMQIIDLWNY